MEKLDEKDLQILSLLANNAKLSTKEIATIVHLTSTPTFERIKRLEREKYIKAYVAKLDETKLLGSFCVFCNIRLKQHNRDYMLAFVEAVSNIPEITECYNISGDSDYMIKIRVKDMDHYSRFVQDTLGTIESIGSLHSLFVLKQEK